LEKTVGAGQKIDIVLTIVRIGFFFHDHEIITSNLAKAEECVRRSLVISPVHADAMFPDSLTRVAIGTGEIG
jgi:hypothetical protein